MVQAPKKSSQGIAPPARKRSVSPPKGVNANKPKAQAVRKKAASGKKTDVVKIPKEELFVVGIGASAGGLEALRPLVTNLPALSNMTYVVAQHLSPDYRSMLAQLLGRETEIKIEEIVDGTVVEKNTIYITPPNKDVLIKNSTLWLRKPSAPVGPKPSVDAFFVSLAEDKGEYAIGVILSGTGTDGAHGIRALKANTGFTIVQDPDTAKYDGMPKAAIATGCVDLLSSPDKIGQELASLARFPRLVVQKSAEAAGRGTVEEIFRLVRNRTDIDFSQYKPNTLRRRLERRLAANRIETLEVYLEYIRSAPQELDLLCKDILISVTSFFRDTKAFKDLSSALPQILKGKKPGDSIRIWVAGCATGEEAYSIAMLLGDHLGKAIDEYTVQIFATDVDLDAMAHARKGLYSEETVKNLDRASIAKYFDQIAQSYQVKKPIRELVVFARQDLAKDPPFVRVDMISCRNVMIYFNSDLQNKIFSVFHYALNRDGYLFLGKSESIGHHVDFFRPIRSTSKLFKKRVGMEKQSMPMFANFRPKVPVSAERQEEKKEVSVTGLMNETFVKAYAPDSVVVNAEMDILHFHENVETFMKLPRGKPNLNLSKLIIDDFRTDLRVLLHRARKERTPVYGTKKMIEQKDGNVIGRLVVRPLHLDDDDDFLYLVSCETEKPVTGGEVAERAAPDHDVEMRITELEQELIATKENLQTVVEELETSNEELQALNEEMQAANEELQSSNEELETSNEELQSTNEELTTVNEELQVRTLELGDANTDLENIQDNIGFALIVVDRELRVTRFTPQSVRLFGLMATDLGQLITTVPSHTDIKDLRSRLNEVILSGKSHHGEVVADNLIYRMRIAPYHNSEGKTDGAILTFIDETEARMAQKMLQVNEEWVRNVTDSVPALICHADANEKYRFTNRPYAEFYGKTVEKVITSTVKDVVGSTNYKIIKPFINKVLKGEAQTFEQLAVNANGEKSFMNQRFEPHINENGEVIGFFAILSDINALKTVEADLWRAKEKAEEASRAKTDFLANMSHELRTPLNAIMAFSEIIHHQNYGPIDIPKYTEYAWDIHESGRHLLSLINEILDLSKIEARKIDLCEEEVDVKLTIGKAIKLISERAEHAGVKVISEFAEPLPKLWADETSFKRIVINLLDNAVKFTNDGGMVKVAASASDVGFDVIVSDTGIGIPSGDIERIIRPFEQVLGPMSSDKGGGTGLGLSITKSLTELHDGVLDITSQVGRGTTVTISFPASRLR